MRKAYASQESVATTLTQAELAAPFKAAPPDDDPLPAVTREAVLRDEDGTITHLAIDWATGHVVVGGQDAGGGP